MKYKVAIIEDDDLIRSMIKFNLEKKGYRVCCFSSVESMMDRTQDELFDLIILDIILPGISGKEFLEKIRKAGDNTPVVMLTVKDDINTKIRTFNSGADDYVVKPFNMEELLARVKALIRRSQGKRRLPSSKILAIGKHKINLSTRLCKTNLGNRILSEKEIKLLSYFSEHSNETLTRADILEEVWGMDVTPTPRTIDNFILKFRKLFEENPEKPKHFVSVRNKGYRFQP